MRISERVAGTTIAEVKRHGIRKSSHLITRSKISRRFFLSLSPEEQMRHHEMNSYIHSAQPLHLAAYADEKMKHAEDISELLM